VVLWRAGLRIGEALALAERDHRDGGCPGGVDTPGERRPALTVGAPGSSHDYGKQLRAKSRAPRSLRGHA